MGRERHVLHVDDDEQFAGLTATYLERIGDFEVTSTRGQSGAIDVVASEPIDCVVCDYELDGHDGLDVLAAVRDREPLLPFVLFTGRGSEGVASDAIAAGATDYLQKGTGDRSRFELLANRIESAIDEAEARHRLRSSRRRIHRLHTVAREFETCTTSEDVYRATVDAAEDILSFDWVFVAVPTGEHFEGRPRDLDSVFAPTDPIPLDAGVLAQTYETGESVVVDDVHEHDVAEPRDERFRAGLSVPVGDQAVLQAVSDEPGWFDEYDREHAELLASHAAAALTRVESEQLYRTLVDQSHDGIYVYQDSTFEFVNERVTELTGYDPGELYEMDLWELVHEDDRDRIRETARSADDGPVVREARVIRKDGSVRHMALSTAKITYNGEPAFMGAARDVTERRRRERQLERQNERLEQFASVVSHDLQNPLAVAQGSLEAARETGDEDHIENAADALGRMSALISDVLALAREGSEVVDPDTVFLSRVASAAWTTVDTQGANLELGEDAMLFADADRLQRLFENCIRNAVEHGRPDDWTSASVGDSPAAADGDDALVNVEIGASPDGDGFYVADDGPGIPDGERERVFESGVTTDPDGTGFGLAIVAEIADAHDWQVTATESDLGGACIEVSGVETPSQTCRD